jgi:hypothetical protein
VEAAHDGDARELLRVYVGGAEPGERAGREGAVGAEDLPRHEAGEDAVAEVLEALVGVAGAVRVVEGAVRERELDERLVGEVVAQDGLDGRHVLRSHRWDEPGRCVLAVLLPVLPRHVRRHRWRLLLVLGAAGSQWRLGHGPTDRSVEGLYYDGGEGTLVWFGRSVVMRWETERETREVLTAARRGLGKG